MAMIGNLPLLYDFNTPLLLKSGRHIALVQVSGKALVEPDSEAGETTIYGIDPGGFWGLGETFEDAWANFYDTLQSSLSDLAVEAEDPEAFCKEVRRLLAPAHQGLQDDWQAAAEARRNGEVETHGLPVNEDYGERGVHFEFVEIPKDKQKQSAAPTQRPQIAA